MIQGNRSFCKASLWETLVKLSSGRLCKNHHQTAGVPASSQEANTRVWFGCKAVKNFLGALFPCSWPTGAGERIQDGTRFLPKHIALKKKKNPPSLSLGDCFLCDPSPPGHSWLDHNDSYSQGEKTRQRPSWSARRERGLEAEKGGLYAGDQLSRVPNRNQLPKPPGSQEGWLDYYVLRFYWVPSNKLLTADAALSQFKWVSLFL